MDKAREIKGQLEVEVFSDNSFGIEFYTATADRPAAAPELKVLLDVRNSTSPPTTAPDSKPDGDEKPNLESEARAGGRWVSLEP